MGWEPGPGSRRPRVGAGGDDDGPANWNTPPARPQAGSGPGSGWSRPGWRGRDRASESSLLMWCSSGQVVMAARAGAGRGGLRNSSSAQRDPGAGARMGRDRLAQCEPSATQSTPPRAVRAQRDGIRPSSIRASPPRTMRPEVTSPIRLPQGAGARPRLRDGRTAPAASAADDARRAPACATASVSSGAAAISSQARPRLRDGRDAVGRLPPGRRHADGRRPGSRTASSASGAGRAGASARRAQWWAPRWVQWSRRNGGCRGGRRGPGRFPAPARRGFLGPPRLVGRWARSALLAPQVPRAARASPDTE